VIQLTSEKNVWNTIADSWTNLRVKPEEEVVKFSEKINNGPILDIGCGNCRNLLPFLKKGFYCVGMDFSSKMIKESKKFLKKRNLKANLVIGDLVNLPFKKRSFLSVICIRALHHVTPRILRLKSLEEMKRVGFKILLSEWKRWQLRFFWKLIKGLIFGHFGDVYVDWNYHGKKYKRFHHLYTKKELEDDLKVAGFKIEKIWDDDKGNIWGMVNV
jgi:ubiquinone/menaquinone biosynthesis C-methylase UbiE